MEEEVQLGLRGRPDAGLDAADGIADPAGDPGERAAELLDQEHPGNDRPEGFINLIVSVAAPAVGGGGQEAEGEVEEPGADDDGAEGG